MKVVITTKKRSAKYMGDISYINEEKDLLVLDNMIILDKDGNFKVASKSDKKRKFKISRLSRIDRIN